MNQDIFNTQLFLKLNDLSNNQAPSQQLDDLDSSFSLRSSDIPFSNTRHLSISHAFDPFNSSLPLHQLQQQHHQLQQVLHQQQQQQQQPFDPFNSFQLPLELQGGISNISSRRPSYTAEFYNREATKPFHTNLVHLDNGLLLEDNFIITSKELQEQYHKTINYFGDIALSKNIVNELNSLCNLNDDSVLNQRISKILKFLKFKNDDLKFQTKNYTLILNKNNKIDLISIPKNSNLKLLKNDLIIIEGDRGKDLVLVLEPMISFNFAILFNYLKKKLHLKSLTFGQEPILNNFSIQQHSNQQQQQLINEDENFITLPNKQILRFVKPFEINQLFLKFNDELMTLKLCLNYILNLNLKLVIRNVEFQFDKKKIIIYYYCNKRLDFRGLIKELFKVYKTRIWLCAILPTDNDAKYILDNFNNVTSTNDLLNLLNLPIELNSINDFVNIKLEKFHGEIFLNLIKDFKNDLSNDQTFNSQYSAIANSVIDTNPNTSSDINHYMKNTNIINNQSNNTSTNDQIRFNDFAFNSRSSNSAFSPPPSSKDQFRSLNDQNNFYKPGPANFQFSQQSPLQFQPSKFPPNFNQYGQFGNFNGLS